jgi:tRNA(Ile)-lysidine synthase
VANSGGPDSICLLYLLHQYFKYDAHSVRSTEVVSLTVDHALQEKSSDMANLAQNVAHRLGVRERVYKVNWGEGLIPPRPNPGEPFESLARRVRYHLLFKGMTETRSTFLALGHHGDDQVETSLLRLSQWSSEIGAAGMLPRRLWGMGDGEEGGLDWAGIEGLRRWIIRPLLPFSKVRLSKLSISIL